jgi:hypothetical protein
MRKGVQNALRENCTYKNILLGETTPRKIIDLCLFRRLGTGAPRTIQLRVVEKKEKSKIFLLERRSRENDKSCLF